jgi:hypothetical protein
LSEDFGGSGAGVSSTWLLGISAFESSEDVVVDVVEGAFRTGKIVTLLAFSQWPSRR